MEERLKKERRRLFRRIILMMLGIFLIVSGTFCAVRLMIEKNNLISKESLKFNNLTKAIEDVHIFDESYFEFFYDANTHKPKNDCQLIICDPENDTPYFNTASSGRFKVESEIYPILIDYQSIRNLLTENDILEIKKFLKQHNDGKDYELWCTKFLLFDIFAIPTELKLKSVYGNQSQSQIDKDEKTYTLKKESGRVLYDYYHESNLNTFSDHITIPNDFLLGDKVSEDLISTFSKNAQTINGNPFVVPFYAEQQCNDLMQLIFPDDNFADGYWVNRFGIEHNASNEGKLTIKYAKRINLLDNCKIELYIGSAVIFSFILIIAVILCTATWKIKKIKILTEQQKLNIFNALVHDVKTPLFVISGYAQCLEEDIDHEERALYIEKIMEQADVANHLVCQMLNYSKLDSYNLTLHKTDFDLCELAADILQNYTVLPNHKSIVLTHSGDNTVNADKELIKTVLQNVTDNAVKYALPDSEIHITITGTACSVSNRTVPISSEELQQLQQPFVHKDRGNRQKGSGLGLSIIKSILKLHDAALAIKMKDDTFICSFKL